MELPLFANEENISFKSIIYMSSLCNEIILFALKKILGLGLFRWADIEMYVKWIFFIV